VVMLMPGIRHQLVQPFAQQRDAGVGRQQQIGQKISRPGAHGGI
jgi:hypothetical protein